MVDGALAVDDAWRCHAHSEQRALGVGDELVADPADERQRGATGLRLAGVRAAGHDLAVEVDDGADELRRLGDVEADDVAAVGVDPDERRRLADAAGRR